MYIAKKNIGGAVRVAKFLFQASPSAVFFNLFCRVYNIYAQICFVYENIFLNLHSKLCEDRRRSLQNVQASLRFTRWHYH